MKRFAESHFRWAMTKSELQWTETSVSVQDAIIKIEIRVKFQPQFCRGMKLYHQVSPSVSFLSQFTIGFYYAAKCNTKLHLETSGMTVSSENRAVE